jgi:hypothetical protein
MLNDVEGMLSIDKIDQIHKKIYFEISEVLQTSLFNVDHSCEEISLSKC